MGPTVKRLEALALGILGVVGQPNIVGDAPNISSYFPQNLHSVGPIS